MSWITVVWSMISAACATLALVHLSIWLKQRERSSNLMFFLTAMSVAVFAGGELALMQTQTPEQYGATMRWMHVPAWAIVLSLVGFVRLYLGAGRPWLAWSVCGVRTLALGLNFVFSPNVNYRTITALRHINFLGEAASIAEGTPNPWMLVGQFDLLLLVVFVVDATIEVWRRGDRQQAAIVGGSIVIFVIGGAGQMTLIFWGVLHSPITTSCFYMGLVAAMGYELSNDIVRSVQLASDLNKSGAALQEIEQRMSLATSAADLLVWSWDTVRDEVWLSDNGRTLFGLEEGGRIDLNRFIEVLHPEDRAENRLALTQLLRGADSYEREYRVVLPDGQTRWIAARGRLAYGPDGRAVAVRGVSFDVTRRKQAEDRCQLIVEAASNAMLMVDREGTIILANARTQAVFGYERQELLGSSVELLIPAHLRAECRVGILGYIADPKTQTLAAGRDLFGLRKDGSEVSLEIGLSPLYTPEGMFILASIIDVTQRRQVAREMQQQRDELAHLSRVTMLGELSGSLAHELNQPLTAILSNAQAAIRFLARDSADLGEVRGILQDIVEEDKRAGEVIHRLRLLFKKGEVQYQELNLNDAVEDVLKLLHSNLVDKNVSVKRELAPDLPRARGDRVQLQQVVINLIVNGCDAMAGVEPRHRVLLVRTDTVEGNRARVLISDQGCGIAADQHERLFQPFFTTKSGGMGLGLAVCRTIISAHGGELRAENNADRGASFQFAIPAA